ncbi:MAG: mechanosensitive ion channel, partial [Gammaproteobacteria bacterium]|nr:mechanosensitive ion channel [Gammaproteobacteria bacterium]
PFSRFNTEILFHQKGLSLPRQVGRVVDHQTELLIAFGFSLIFLITLLRHRRATRSPQDGAEEAGIRKWGQFVISVRFIALGGLLAGFELLLFTEDANYLDVDLTTLALIVKMVESSWYLYWALVIHVFLNSYLWPKIAKSTGHPVPSIARTLVSIVLFVAVLTLIYSLVFGHSMVSIIATSGALTVVLGFALRELILDFFAGIILNIEKPFHIDDYVQFHIVRGLTVEGKIIEMNWRTVRLRDEHGNMVVLPNSKISVEHLNNMSTTSYVRARMQFYINPEYDPQRIIAHIEAAALDNPFIVGYDDPKLAPKVRYRGLENVGDSWVARYALKAALPHLGKRNKAFGAVWKKLWQRLHDDGISIDPTIHDHS